MFSVLLRIPSCLVMFPEKAEDFKDIFQGQRVNIEGKAFVLQVTDRGPNPWHPVQFSEHSRRSVLNTESVICPE